MTSKIFYISLFFLVPFYLFSQSNEKAEYVIQFKSLLLDEVDEKYLHLAESIPRLLYYEFKDYPVHRYSLEELTALSQRNYDDYIQNHFLNLSLYIEKRDSLIFNNNYNKEDYLKIIDQIEEERDLLSAVKVADVEEMEKDVPLRFFTESDGSEDSGTVKSRKSDMDINGSIEKLGEWLYL
ncbi:MAG: hypothetical protein L3J12_09290, partial [Spirochaetales bacterium]|nr:hypothetical protein [Spirochaetales bacterium]